MNTEINLLEKQPNKYLLPLLLTLIFVVLLALVALLIYFQQNEYSQSISVKKENISQIETLLQEHNQETASEQKLGELKQEVELIEAAIIPNVAFYRTVLELLDSPDQFISFDYTGNHQFVLDASFVDLDSVALFLSILLNRDYILDAELTSVNRAEESYIATLTFHIDPAVMREELSDND